MSDPLQDFPADAEPDDQIEWLAKQQIARSRAGDTDGAATLDHRFRILLNDQLTERNAALETELQAASRQLKTAEASKLAFSEETLTQIFSGMMTLLRADIKKRDAHFELRIEQRCHNFPNMQQAINDLQRALRRVEDEVLVTKALRKDPNVIICGSSSAYDYRNDPE